MAEVQIQYQNDNTFNPSIKERANDFFLSLKEKIDEDEIETLKNETVSILSNCVNPSYKEPNSTTNLVVGYVQSGKTMSFTALSALASDNGFRIIIYFAGNKNNLLDQTSERLKKDLGIKYYRYFQNPNAKNANEINGKLQIEEDPKPTVLITVLKIPEHINNLANLFNSKDFKNTLQQSAVLIIDDEADQASLNGYAYKNSKSEEWEEDEFTATYKNIKKLRDTLPLHSYIQYTATPQGPILISINDMLSPKHHTVLTPGKNYTGGKTFFRDEPGLVIEIPKNEYNPPKNISTPPNSLLEALKLHVLAVALVTKWPSYQKNQEKIKFLSMMIHADREKKVSKKFYNWTNKIIKDGWQNAFNSDKNDIKRIRLLDEFKKSYPEAIYEYKKHGEQYPEFEEIKKFIPDIIRDTKINLITSDSNEKEVNWEDGSSSHILIGAEMLNRGFTVKNLATTYMPRYSKKTNADTIQQRCRFFGYKKDYLWSCRVFLPLEVQLEYKEYVDHEEEMRKYLKENTSLEDIEHNLLSTSNINLTRKNILSKDVVTNKLSGWRQINAFQETSIESNKNVVRDFIGLHEKEFKNYTNYGTKDRNHRYLKISVKDTIEFLSRFKCQNYSDSMRRQVTIRYLKYLSSRETLRHIDFIYIIQMAYSGEARERAFNSESEKINELFTGRSPSGSITYPGDREIKFEDSICIQIHNIRLKCPQDKRNGKEAYTLAFYYPEDFATNYIGQNYE